MQSLKSSFKATVSHLSGTGGNIKCGIEYNLSGGL